MRRGEGKTTDAIQTVAKPCRSPRPVLPLTTQDKKASLAVVWLTADSQLRMRDIEGFCDNFSSLTHLPHQKKDKQEGVEENSYKLGRGWSCRPKSAGSP